MKLRIKALILLIFLTPLLCVGCFIKAQKDEMFNNVSSEIVLAVIDSGVSTDIVDSYPYRFVVGYNVIERNVDITDENGHGTKINELILSDFEGKSNFKLNERVKIMNIKAFDADGNTTNDYISEAIRFATDNGSQVINLSFGSYSEYDDVNNSIEYALSKGVIVVASGEYNSNGELSYPASIKEVICATNESYKDIAKGNCKYVLNMQKFFRDNETLYMEYNGASYSTIVVSAIICDIIEKNDCISNVDELEKELLKNMFITREE